MSEYGTLVVTTDFSETSRGAFAPALAIARKFASTVVVVHVVEERLPAFVDEFAAIPVEEILDSQARRAVRELERFVKPYRRDDRARRPPRNPPPRDREDRRRAGGIADRDVHARTRVHLPCAVRLHHRARRAARAVPRAHRPLAGSR